MQQFDFDEIRPYRDCEVNTILTRLLKEPFLAEALPYVSPETSVAQLADVAGSIHSTHDFQIKIILPIMERLIRKTTAGGVQLLGLENIDRNRAYLFMSNHRDIVLDAAFLNTCFMQENIPLSEVAIGDNLLLAKWIRDLVRLNRSFIVQRGNMSPRAFLESSKRLSAYIRHTITDSSRSVWIAQREGRAKDSDDRTQEALLKMLNMSGKTKSPAENLVELAICPLALSYEYDPCDFLKAKEFQQKRDNPEYKKAPQDDLLSMQTGIFGQKGRVVLRFAGDVGKELAAISATADNADQLALAAALIDKHIYRNYVIFSNNKVAYDLLLETNRFESEYSPEEKLTFENYLQKQLDKIDLPDKDTAFLRRKILEMYANPLINQLRITN